VSLTTNTCHHQANQSDSLVLLVQLELLVPLVAQDLLATVVPLVPLVLLV